MRCLLPATGPKTLNTKYTLSFELLQPLRRFSLIIEMTTTATADELGAFQVLFQER